jgi:hypothetical protein
MKTIKQVIGIDVPKDTFHVCFGSIDETQSIKVVRQSSLVIMGKALKSC